MNYSTDAVNLRNTIGNVVSTSGALQGSGSPTRTYQMKDDLMTYAYAYPTPGAQNSFVTWAPTTFPATRLSSSPTVTTRPTANTTSMPNLIITELADPKDKAGARYVELYSLYGSGQTINNSTLYLLRWNNANAGKNAQ
jgi:hypothetical protein